MGASIWNPGVDISPSMTQLEADLANTADNTKNSKKVGFKQSGTGAVSRTLQDREREIITLTDFGANGNGIFDNSDAFAKFVAELKNHAYPIAIIPRGVFKIESGIVIDHDNLTIEWYGQIVCDDSITGTAVRIGSSTVSIANVVVDGGGIDIRRTPYDVAGSSFGLELRDLLWSQIKIRTIRGFDKGCILNSTHGGISHCRVDIGELRDNRYNLFLTASGTGYCNENSFYKGSFGHTSSWNAAAGSFAGTYDIYEDDFSAGNPLNNNKFFGPSLEAGGTATIAAQIYGEHTHIYAPRLETASGVATDLKLRFGTASKHCLVTSGQNIVKANIVDDGVNNRFLLDDYTILPNGTKYLIKSLSADANYTLVYPEYVNSIIRFDSSVALTATRDIIVPLDPRQWTIWNNTTGAQSIRVIGPTGTGITIANGKHAIVYANGANIIRVTPDT